MQKIVGNNLANLSKDGQRKKRTRLALTKKVPFDNKAYQKAKAIKDKKAMEEWKSWFS